MRRHAALRPAPHRLAPLLVGCACLAAWLALAPQARADEVRRSTLQIAAIQGMTHTDAGNHVLLERDGVRMRVYPGTATMIVAGRQYSVKDRFVREAGRVMVSPRVQRFMTGQMTTACARARSARARIVQPASAGLPPLEPLPPRVHRAKRKPRVKPADHQVTPTAKRAVRGDPRWTPRGATERRWEWIVIHHSDDRSGNLAKYHDVHLKRGWEHGCGYHFVVGNGTQSGDGEIEMSKRWLQQLHGAHAKVPDNRFNERGIGICLVGDFDENGRRPTPAQMQHLVRLIRWLKVRYGITDANVRGHRDCCATQCPGKYFPWDELRERTR